MKTLYNLEVNCARGGDFKPQMEKFAYGNFGQTTRKNDFLVFACLELQREGAGDGQLYKTAEEIISGSGHGFLEQRTENICYSNTRYIYGNEGKLYKYHSFQFLAVESRQIGKNGSKNESLAIETFDFDKGISSSMNPLNENIFQ